MLMKIFRHLLLAIALIAIIHNGSIAEAEHTDIKAEVTKRHDEAVKRLQDWIAQVSIAAEDRGYPEGAEYMANLARDAGFQQATVINTDGKPGVFATLNAGARLVPDMKTADALAALKAHLAKRGFGDIEVNMTGGYDTTATSKDSVLIEAQLATYKKFGIDALLWPRNAGSYPGYVFTGEPLKLAAGHFGLGHGSSAHAPDE